MLNFLGVELISKPNLFRVMGKNLLYNQVRKEKFSCIAAVDRLSDKINIVAATLT